MVETPDVNIIPQNEEQRLEALHRYRISGTPPEESFNNIARIMADVFNTPIALISMVDREKVYFKGNVGMRGVRYTDRQESLCSFAILSNKPTIFSNPLDEPCLLTNPLVHGQFGLRFYAGAPLTTQDGYNIGSVCLVDKVERSFSDAEQDLLVRFAKLVMNEIELRQFVIKQTETEQQLKAANEELEFVTHSVPQLIWISLPNGHSYFFNQGWFDYTGLSLEEVKGMGWIQSLHPEDLERTLSAWGQAVKTGENFEIEYRLRSNDGTYRWFLVRAKPMKNEYGAILKWYGTNTDINDQKLAEEALTKSKERFDLVAKATQDAIWDWDLNTNLIWWNDGFKELFGYNDEDIEPTIESWYSRVHPEDKERVINGIHAVIDNGGSNWSSEYRFRKKDGSYSIVDDRGYALQDKQGKPYRMLGSMQDVSRRKLFEEALKESEARTRLAVESAQMGTYEIDLNNQSIIHSRRAAEIFGLDPERQWSYKNFIDLIHPEDRILRQTAHESALKTGNLFYETRIILQDGVVRWIRLNGTLINHKGSPFLIGTTLDISEEKEAATVLERRIQERTIELKAANDQLQQFTYAASHDLQEPLRKISYFIDRLLANLGSDLLDENKRIADRILHTTNRMRTLINDLLDYSNTTMGATRMLEVDLNVVVSEVLDDMEATIIEKSAIVNLQELPKVKGDQRQLKQLFQNLLGNALKYHKKNEQPVVEIGSKIVTYKIGSTDIEKEALATNFHLIEVRDKGIGIAEEDAGRIFGLFQRLHGKAEYEGTGLGLAIVQKVVENHHGYINVESKPGEGATFKVLLPV